MNKQMKIILMIIIMVLSVLSPRKSYCANDISNTQLYKMAGNSIVVNVAEFLFCQIFDSENEIWV